MSDLSNNSPYMRTSREFPEDLHQTTVELNKAYIDIANTVNNRVIGDYPTHKPAITGENWFTSDNRKQQSLRRRYEFTSDGSKPHKIKTDQLSSFTKCTGFYTDGTNWYGQFMLAIQISQDK